MKKQKTVLYTDILILGGGLTGLSAAYHLEKKGFTNYLLVEKNSFFGGLSASQQINDFTFDYSGHLLHLHHPYTLALVKKLLRGNLIRHKRQAFIDFDGKRIPFPFQANLWALPKDIATQCLSATQKAIKRPSKTPKNFEQWCLQSFGEGIYQYFLKPYNEKLWQTKLTELTWDWCADFVPRLNLKQIVACAKHASKKQLGYNSYFYYPRRGGCGALAEAFSTHIPNTWLNAKVQRIDLKKKCVRINGQDVYFKRLLNTLPLPSFVKLCSAAPVSVKQAAKQLKATQVFVWQLAINRAIKPFHWIYFPHKDTPFFRVGMQSSFSQNNAPNNTTSFYIETAQKITDFKSAEEAFFNILVQKGIIKKQDKILCSFWRTLSPAYAMYDFKRLPAQRRIIDWLSNQKCLCMGRYGLWEYSFMERNILQGRDVVNKLNLGK